MKVLIDLREPIRVRRLGFSLIEMMIVIMIIAILAAITAAGAFQVMASRRVANTELLVKKVEDALLKQWRKVIDQASQEPIPEVYLTGKDSNGNQVAIGLLDMAGRDIKRARVLWVKLRLKQEFPMSFEEALSPNQGTNYLPQRIGGNPVGNLTYRRAIELSPALPPSRIDQSLVFNSSPASALLLLAVSQGRTGADFNPEDLGAISLTEGQFPRSSSTDVISLKQIVDSWNHPIVFSRWPIRNREIQGSNPAVGASQSEKFRDPLDPEGLLLQTTWNNQSNLNNGPVGAFEALFHPIHEVDVNGNYQPRAYYSTPVVASAGKDGNLGINGPFMAPDGTGRDNDNIYSHRLRLGARGD